MKIAVAGGVTGGHIYPAVAVLQYFINSSEHNIEVLYFATPHGLENREIVRHFPNAVIEKLDIQGLSRPVFSLKNFRVLQKTLKSYFVCKEKLKEFSPDFTFITGGYVSVPLGIASQRLGIPTFVHEQNAISGLANKMIAKRAKKIFISFSDCARDFGINNAHKIVFTGNPVRLVKERDRGIFQKMGVPPSKKVILVTGGSQGSDFLNKTMTELYSKNYPEFSNVEFVHSCGDEKFLDSLKKFDFVHPYSFIEDMHLFLASADAVIARGGATTVAEIISYGIPGLIVPWPGAAEDHQLLNAIALERNQAGFFLEEKETTVEEIRKKINSLLDKKTSIAMKSNLNQMKPKIEPAVKIFKEIYLSINKSIENI